MSGYIKTCPNCGEYVLPPAVQVVTPDGPPYQRADCVICGWHGFTDELKFKFIPTMLVGEPPPPESSIRLEFIGESCVFSPDPTTTVTNVTIDEGDAMLVAYNQEINAFGGNPSATWNGQSVGSQFGWGNDPEEQQSTFPLFQNDAWMVFFRPSVFGTGDLVVNNPGSISNRALSVFRIIGAGNFTTLIPINDGSGQSVSFGPYAVDRDDAEFFVLMAAFTVGADGAGVGIGGSWSGTTRVRTTEAAAVAATIDVSTSGFRSPMSASLSGFSLPITSHGGIVMGFRP